MVMVFSLASCGEVPFVAKKNLQQDEVGSEMAKDDPLYNEVADMIEPISDFIEYNHILNNSINYEDVSAEDFWNIVAIVVSAYSKSSDYAEIDNVGVYHMSWDDMIEFAKTFMYQSWFKNNAPSYKTSYSASADPGSGIIDLIPLSVDNFTGSLVAIEKADSEEKPYDYILNIDLTGPEDNPVVHHYHAYISRWDTFLSENYNMKDETEHIMPFVVTGYQFLSTDEPEN